MIMRNNFRIFILYSDSAGLPGLLRALHVHKVVCQNANVLTGCLDDGLVLLIKFGDCFLKQLFEFAHSGGLANTRLYQGSRDQASSASSRRSAAF